MTDNHHTAPFILEFAPMEGITTAAYRNAHRVVFGGADLYYAPFITTGRAFLTRTRDRRDVSPDENRDTPLIPQLLSNDSAGFLSAAETLAEMGYSTVNLNLGCPSPTVVSRRRGAGFLTDPDELDRFFSDVFDALPAIRSRTGTSLSVSVKTRIGIADTSEAGALMDVFNRYPISELIIHPRLQREFYRGSVHMDVFLDLFRRSRNPVCYNGDLLTVEDASRVLGLCRSAASPEKDVRPLHGIMIGRGAVRNPAIFRMLRGKAAPGAEEIRRFLTLLLRNTASDISGEQNQLMKMKEVWNWLGLLFENSERYVRKIRKAKNLNAYRVASDALLSHCSIGV